jgi:threonylcarbamoyladenosine tRNA methylthiotransferase MtaB
MTTPGKPQLLTFGCRLNIYESEVMSAHAQSAGMQDAIIVNTCAVTKEAERQARQAIRRARRENPDATIIVTGCAAQVNAEKFAAMPEVSHVIGNDLKLEANTWLGLADSAEKTLQVNDIMAVTETASHLLPGFEGHVRAFLQVQNGCDHRCTFCIIPYGRGNSRSVPVGVIADQLRTLVAQGYKEAVLTGVDVTSYGKDLPGQPSLGQMIRRILALVPELPRLRLSSLDPVEIDDDLWRLIAEEPRLMPHLHLSLQAGADLILKRMKRRHLQRDIYNVVEKARGLRPDMVFGADIIAGFPTETDAHFADSLKVVNECDLTYLHVFPYSERDGTPAARMPQLPLQTRKDRAAQLRDLGAAQLAKFYATQAGQSREILVETNGVGRTEHFAEVTLPQNIPPRTLMKATLGPVSDNKLTVLPETLVA